ncbi:hypothetical protein [Nonomuraea sp. LPB2021202275-12-8]|uniref:hypothetical protein n=1 Tax=Nonomuraea sp. LPB2021202275-12-8 TaxID=3120159 RepID=UPI00300D2F92
MVTLTAGVTWLGANPAAAAECRNKPTTVRSPGSTATLCDDLRRIRVDDSTGSNQLVGSESGELALSAARMAERIGLTGLASARSAMGLSDLGGIVATSGMPVLSSPGIPARTGLPSLTRLPDVPDLPNLPNVPGTPNLPVGMTVGNLPNPAKVAEAGVEAPLNLPGPVNQIKRDLVERTLPQVPSAVGGVNDGTRLPDAQTSLDGLTGMLHGLDLR